LALALVEGAACRFGFRVPLLVEPHGGVLLFEFVDAGFQARRSGEELGDDPSSVLFAHSCEFFEWSA